MQHHMPTNLIESKKLKTEKDLGGHLISLSAKYRIPLKKVHDNVCTSTASFNNKPCVDTE